MEVLVKRCLVKAPYSRKQRLWCSFPSNKKFLLVDLEGADYKLYDPDIATIETLIEALSAEELFYIGNLRETVINIFFAAHKCNVFCLELKMAEIQLSESEEDEE